MATPLTTKMKTMPKIFAGVEECYNQPEIPVLKRSDHQEKIPGVTTPEEEEEITETDKLEEED